MKGIKVASTCTRPLICLTKLPWALLLFFLMVSMTTTLLQFTAIQKASSILKNICISSFENIF
jgi:hypothetical protein